MNKKKLIDLIIMSVTGFSKNQLFLTEKIPDKYNREIKQKIKSLESGEPIEYIINNAEFFGLDFYVDKRVLIPRNDTEVMIEQALSLTLSQREKGQKQILIDVGTGSACIPVSVLNELRKKNFALPKTFAIDISKDALEVAKINVEKYNLEDKIELIQGDLLKPLSSKLSALSSIIITANLPYIKNGDFENMDKETIAFEPSLALYGGKKTGFELYEKLIFQIFDLIQMYDLKNIILFIEIGFDQKEIASNFLKKQNLKFEIFKDNGGIDRCIKIVF